VVEDLEVVVEVHALPVLRHDPGMPGDFGAAVEDDYFGGAKEDPYRASDDSGRNGVGSHPYPNEA